MIGQSEFEKRINNVERQLSIYERLFQTFSGKLDYHFKRYDLLIKNQKQQINALTEILSGLLRDQSNYSNLLRDKFIRSLNDLAQTEPHLSGLNNLQTDNTQNEQHPQFNGSSLSNFDAILGEFISPQVQTDEFPIIDKPIKKPIMKRMEHRFIVHQRSLQHDHLNSNKSCIDAKIQNKSAESSTTGFNVNFSTLNENIHLNSNNNHTVNSPIGKNTIKTSDSIFQNKVDSIGTSVSPVKPLSLDSESQIKEEQYYTYKGKKKKRKIYVGQIEFLNSPQSVMDIWNEYTEGIKGQPSLKEMELIYHTSWRRDPAVNKRFHRRKVLCKAIERGLDRGFSLQDIVQLLENSRIIDKDRGLKQPIGWLCQGINIPDVLKL